MQEPWASVVRLETESYIVASVTSVNDVTANGIIMVVVDGTSGASDDVEVMLQGMGSINHSSRLTEDRNIPHANGTDATDQETVHQLNFHKRWQNLVQTGESFEPPGIETSITLFGGRVYTLPEGSNS